MTTKQAQEHAARLGLSAWTIEAIAVGERSEVRELMCIGFAGIDLVIAEAETWEAALEQAARLAFGA